MQATMWGIPVTLSGDTNGIAIAFQASDSQSSLDPAAFRLPRSAIWLTSSTYDEVERPLSAGCLSQHPRAVASQGGRRCRIRTCDPLLPKQMRYQAALISENRSVSPRDLRGGGFISPIRHTPKVFFNA